MELLFSDEFKKDFRRIRDKTTRLRIIKAIKRLAENPEAGKPLQYELKNYRTLRVPPFRILYRLQGNSLVINCFGHRNDIYK